MVSNVLSFLPTLSSLSPHLAGVIVYLGMMAGAFVLGGLADKLGRKRVLSMSLALNASFASLSSFVQGYGAFLFCRLLSGIGYANAGLCWTLIDQCSIHPGTIAPSGTSGKPWTGFCV